MSKMILAAGVAALAMTAPAVAQHGNGHGGGGGHAMQDHGNKGGGGGNARGGQQGGGKGHGAKVEVSERGQGHGNGGGNVHASVKAHGNDVHVDKVVRVDRGSDRVVRSLGDGDGRVFPRLTARDAGLVNGCPPGLAMKGNGCMPPGQYKKIGEQFGDLARAQALVGPYSQWYRDNDRYYYRMGDGVLYQVNRSNNLIDALIPYGMRDYSYYPVGYGYPDLYNSYNVPYAYRSYYPDGGDYLYRYGGNAIYAVDPKTQAISSIVSLLAGDLSVGQPLPTTYGVYNVPLAYRDRYYDTADNWYRYNDGYIYRVDPTTQLVTAVINALV